MKNSFHKKNINYLTLVPTQGVKEFTVENDKVTLLIPKFKRPFFQRMLLPKHKSPHFKVHLDELGSKVWLLANGVRNVEQICNELAEQTSVETQESEQMEYRVTKFLTELYKSRFVRFENLEK